MSEQRTIASARVTVTLQVDADGTWGDDCTLKQMHDQAGENAVQQVRFMLQEHRGHAGMVIVGEPSVELISARKR